MKKLVLLLLVLAACEEFAFSQSLVFMRNGVELNNGETYIANEVDDVLFSINPYITVKNVSDKNINATFTVTLLEEMIGDDNAFIGFCGWGVNGFCISVTYEMPKSRSAILASGDVEDPEVEAMNVGSDIFLAKVEYKLNYEGNEQKIYVTFMTGNVGITPLPEKDNIILSYQGENVSMKYNFNNTADYRLNIYNIAGIKIAEINLSDNVGVVQLPIGHKGVYIYSITENNKIFKNGKFIVK
jgi:hypothetical protein